MPNYIIPELVTPKYQHRILINSIPKAGTHLVSTLLNNLGFYYKRPVLERGLKNHPLNLLYFKLSQTCLIGLGQPQKVKLQTIKYLLKNTRRGTFKLGHIPYQPEIVELLSQLHYKIIIVIRDPRDIVVSQIHYYLDHPKHYLHSYYRNKNSIKEQIILAITGIQGDEDWITYGITKKFHLISNWMKEPEVLTVRFENLIGPQGGGISVLQKDWISKIADFLEIPMNPFTASEVGSRLFGKGITFRSGQIGSWKYYFDTDLKKIFNEEAGKLLVQLGYEQDLTW